MKVKKLKGIIKDEQTATSEGVSTSKLPVGVTFKEVPTYIDERGELAPMFDPRWGWHKDPLVYAYFATVKPGYTKGWAMHLKHEDRYFVMQGEMETVLYDAREDSETFGLVSKVFFSEYNRKLMNIPAGVWHSDRNIGTKDVIIVNFPNKPYDFEDPDKYRLPLDTDQIPYKYDKDVKGW